LQVRFKWNKNDVAIWDKYELSTPLNLMIYWLLSPVVPCSHGHEVSHSLIAPAAAANLHPVTMTANDKGTVSCLLARSRILTQILLLVGRHLQLVVVRC
jgi:hypothetical protein